MDRAPSLQDFDPSETRDAPRQEGSGYDYKELAREVLARIDQRLADLERDAPQRPEPRRKEQAAGTAGEVMSPDEQVAFTKLALRSLFALLLAACVVAASVWLWSHKDTAKRVAAEWASRLALASTVSGEKAQASAEQGPPAMSQHVAVAAPVQAAQAPRAAPAANEPKAATVPPELAELMRKVDRDIAGLAQAVTELKLAQQQVSENSAKSAEDIKAKLDQLSRAVARVSEQTAQPKVQVPPAPRTAVSRNRRFGPMYQSPGDAYDYEYRR